MICKKLENSSLELLQHSLLMAKETAGTQGCEQFLKRTDRVYIETSLEKALKTLNKYAKK